MRRPAACRASAVLFVICFSLGGMPCAAQPTGGAGRGAYGAAALGSQPRSIRVAARPAYQTYDDGPRALAQWSLPLRVTIPVLERWEVSLQGSVAAARRDGGASVRGLSDAQVAVSYARKVGESTVVASANANVPVGTRDLTTAEFETATLLGFEIYDFPVSGFGQGAGLSTGVTWAIPLGDDLAVGVGGSYQVQRGYRPIENMSRLYEPGNQGLVTGGIDYRLTRTSALSLSASATFYGTDTAGNLEFDAGPKGAATLQYVRERGYTTLLIAVQYEERGASTRLSASGGGVDQQVFPPNGGLSVRYETRLTEGVGAGGELEGRRFGQTVSHGLKTTLSASGQLSVDLGGGLTAVPEVSYTTGSFTGVAGSLSLIWEE